MQRDPYPHYAAWRDGSRVRRCDFRGGAWLVHRFGDVRHVLRTPADFSSADAAGDAAAPLTMAAADPPEHRRLRAALAPAFGARALAALEPRLAERAAALLDPLASSGECELVGDVALPLASLAVSELLGVPAAERDWFDAGAHALIGRAEGPPGAPAAAPLERLRLVGAMRAGLERLVAERCGPAGAAAAAGTLTEAEAVESCMLIVLAGIDTAARLIANSVLALARHPDDWARAAEGPAQCGAAVDEVLRWDPPLHAVPRTATRELTVAGARIGAGDTVLVMLAAASRDPDAYAQADAFRPGRAERAHLGFGDGVHRCLGAALARLELRVLLEELARSGTAPLELLESDRDLDWGAAFPLLRSPARLRVRARRVRR